MIRLDGVTVHHSRRTDPTVRDVTVHVGPGERVVLLGPSGSGKSTLLQLVSGAVPHAVVARVDGTVQVGEHTLASPMLERSPTVGVVGQDPSATVCLPGVEAEVAFVLENAGVPAAEIGPLVDGALALVDASHLVGRSTAELSGGEVQRVALAAAVVGRPDVLLLDEPTSMLDARGVAAVRDAVAAATRSHGPAVVLVEHRLDELAGEGGVAALPGRAVALDASGRVVADGPTDDVLREQGPRLRDLGCWLPLEAELAAITGAHGSLASGVHDAFLAGLVPEDGLPAGGAPAAGESAAGATAGGRSAAGEPAGSGDVVLAARGLSVGHEDAVVVAGVDLDLRRGEVVALLGSNGCGKSTLLVTLAGLARPWAGTLDGPRPGLVFQNPEHQLVARTVEAELAHGLPAHARDRVPTLLAEHRLEHLRGRHPHRLSGGEKRRLSLAAVLAHDRPALLADEPTFGLDRGDAQAAADALVQAAADGRAVLFSSHDLRLVAQVADRAVVVADGRVVADGDVLDVLRDEVTLAAAGLVVPALVRWFLPRCRTGAQLRAALRATARARSVVPA